jgi:hypothetical protein
MAARRRDAAATGGQRQRLGAGDAAAAAGHAVTSSSFVNVRSAVWLAIGSMSVGLPDHSR